MEYKSNIKSIKELKKEAREMLKGKWGIAIIVSIIAAIITSAFSTSGQIAQGINAASQGLFSGNLRVWQTSESTTSTTLINLGALINLLIGGSITYGLSHFFLKLIRNENPQIENLFLGFKYFGKNFLIQLIMGIFSALWSLLVWIPAIIVISIISVSAFTGLGLREGNLPNMALGTGIILALVIIICIIITYIIVLRYAMAFYIFIDNPHYTVMECISTSKEMMEGNKVRLFILRLSFIGWDILAILTIFIGYLWLNPYVNTANASFYNNLKMSTEPEEDKDSMVSLYKENPYDDNR